MRIAAGWDHRGRQFKEKLEAVLTKLGHEMMDMGAPSTASADYPDYAFKVAEAVSRGDAERGILICGTGIGMSIAANKVRGVRAAVVSDGGAARASRAHNDANVLCLGEWVAGRPEFESLVKLWLETAFEDGRHTWRVAKITEYEKNGPNRIGS